MTVSLVEFPLVPLTDIPARLRLLAEQIEDGDHGTAVTLICILETEDTLGTMAFGDNWCPYRTKGLMFDAMTYLTRDGEE